MDKLSPYYLVTLVFHDQSDDISELLHWLDEGLAYLDIDCKYIHSGPVIRRESPYSNMTIDERRHLIYKMRLFFLNAPIKHSTLIINKKDFQGALPLSAQITKKLKILIENNAEYFSSFDKVNVYYDNGQMELNNVLNNALNAILSNVEFRKSSPTEYRLLQMADFICSIKLLEIKMNEKRLSNSEQAFFYKPQELKKTFIKMINSKEL